MKHLVIPDVQAKPGVNLDHLLWIGKYMVAKRPEVVICIGDFADMPSLCSYDKGKKSFEGRRYKEDIKAAKQAMDLLLQPLREYNDHQRNMRKLQYKPRLVLTMGNHEERILRVSEFSPELDGVIGYSDLPYQDWEVHEFLHPVQIDGVTYVHYLANPMTGKPYGGSALSQLVKVGKSYVVGHKQTLDVATRFTLDGSQQWGIIAGAFYSHVEDYKGPQGNAHWRGAVMLHRVNNGSFDPMFISIDYLKDRYSSE
jgi:hypothetical protein